MAVDERELGEWISENAAVIAPPSFVFLGYFVFAGTQWPMAALALCLSAWYHRSGWDGMILVWYGIGTIAISAFLLFGPPMSASYLALSGYWLCTAGCLRLLTESVLARLHGQQGDGRKKEARAAKRTARKHGGRSR